MSSKQGQSLNPCLIISFSVVIAIVMLSVIGLMHASPPSPLPDAAPASIFSSARAMTYLQTIAQQTHPTGTPENAQVRDYLVDQLKLLGLEPQIQTALAINNRGQHRVAGIVHNVLVKIPGRIRGKALLVAAHYDSTHTGPGAADDGASVAAILETLRALKNLPPLQNDLICLFTDGEEAGLLGAEAFVAEHPWAKHIALVLNFEYRGNRGPLLMFETSPGNGKLIDGLALAVPHPLGNSLMHEVYKRLPNDTDMTVFKGAGIAGMNFAVIDGHTSYHTQLDRPELMQEASLQHEGETMLSLTHYFGNTDLTHLRSSDHVYFDMVGLGMVSYPVSGVLPLCGALVVLFGAVLLLGLKCVEWRATRIALGMAIFLIIVPLLASACQLLWACIQYIHPQYQLMLQGDTYNSHWYLLAFVLLVIMMFGFVQAFIRIWVRPKELMVGAMAVWLMLLVATSIKLPGASFLFFWPLAPALLTTILSFYLSNKNNLSVISVLLSILGVAPGILMFAPFIKALFIGLTVNQIGLVMGFLALFLGLLAPLLDLLTRSFQLPWISLITGLLFLLTGSLTSGFDTEHPRPNNLFYALDSATGKAFWLSKDKYLDDWTRTFFPSLQARRRVPELFGENSISYWTGLAPTLPLQAPVVDILGDSIRSGVRTVNIQVRSLRQAPEFRIFVEGVNVISSKVENRIFSKEVIPEWSLQGFGFPETGLHVELNVQAGIPFKIRAIDFSYELPNTGFRPRPTGMMTQPFGLSDTTAVVNLIAFK